MVTKFEATSRYHNLLSPTIQTQLSIHTIGVVLLPLTNQKPQHKGNRQDWKFLEVEFYSLARKSSLTLFDVIFYVVGLSWISQRDRAHDAFHMVVDLC